VGAQGGLSVKLDLQRFNTEIDRLLEPGADLSFCPWKEEIETAFLNREPIDKALQMMPFMRALFKICADPSWDFAVLENLIPDFAQGKNRDLWSQMIAEIKVAAAGERVKPAEMFNRLGGIVNAAFLTPNGLMLHSKRMGQTDFGFVRLSPVVQ